MKRWVAVCLLTVLLAACDSLLGIKAPESCLFPPDTAVTRVGESPVAALGLSERGAEGQDPPGGTVYVTNDPIVQRPRDEPIRMWCVVYDVGSSTRREVPLRGGAGWLDAAGWIGITVQLRGLGR